MAADDMKQQRPTGQKGDDMKNRPVTIRIETGNAAFEDSPTGEIARILRKLAADIEEMGDFGAVIDYNGNKVGTAQS